MAKNTEPVFTKSPVLGQAAISAANTNIDGSGTIVAVVDGGVDGIRIDQIEAKAEVATTAGMVRLFLSIDSGTTWELWREIDVAALTPSATVQAFVAALNLSVALDDPPLLLADATMVLGASTNNAEAFNVFARGGSFTA
jgi:hypothetical protein